MGKRKIFKTTNLGEPKHIGVNGCSQDSASPTSASHISNKIVHFPKHIGNLRNFDFSTWYGTGVDSITIACQYQIERFLAGQDGAREITSIANYCSGGLNHFLSFCTLQASALGRELTINDINRNLIDRFLSYLSSKEYKNTTQRSIYNYSKAVLINLGRRSKFALISTGDDATFPRNPFPNISRMYKGETEYSKREKQTLASALRDALTPIWQTQILSDSNLLSYALLTIALHTGRNTTPLLEMTRDCLKPHPKDDTFFLVLWKRRGFNSSTVKLRSMPKPEETLESNATVNNSIEQLIRRVLTLTEPLVKDAPNDITNRLWLVRSEGGLNIHKVTTLGYHSLKRATNKLIEDYKLTDNTGQPLRINVSRFRKSFGNRIFKISGDDIAVTAAALGNTVRVTDQHYLAADEESQRNWKFMGDILVKELLSNSLGDSYKQTPTGRCRDPEHGQYAPKNQPGAVCMNFLNCLRCKHYAVTAEDLYKLFSFYYRILSERTRMGKRRWTRLYAHIPRLIDNYIIAEGLRRRIFKQESVDRARALARAEPHPFWSVDIMASLEVMT